MDDEFEKCLKILLDDSQKYLVKNYEYYYEERQADINCPVHKEIKVKYIGNRFYKDGELIGETAPYDYHRDFFLISFGNNDFERSFNATWCDWTSGGSIDYWDNHLANPLFDTEDDWSIDDETKQEFIKIFK
jgi:hypothetical protein